jgi:hypothetical protein
MIKIISAIVLSICVIAGANAQKKEAIDNSASFTVALGSSEISTSLAYQHLWKLGKKQKWEIGAGVRFTNYFGSNQYYTTAPAKLTSGKKGPGVLFADDIPQNIDSVLFKKSQVNSLNLSINFVYNVSKKFDVGFNIDAVGFSFGGKQNGIYLGNNGIGATTAAKPSGFNLLLVSDNDKGALNSELYTSYHFNNKWGAKLGFQFLFTEYTTTTNIQTTPDGQKNNRFRNKSSGISIGITHTF